MLKKFNIVLVTFFATLTVSFGIGYSLLIPIILFYLIRNIKNIYLIVPSGLASLLIFTSTTYLVSYLILMIVILFILWIMEKLNKGIYIYLFVILLNIFTYYLIYRDITNYISFGIYSLISLLLYAYFEKNLVESLRSENKFYNPSYLEIIISIIVIIGAVNFDIIGVNLGFIMSMYFAMYFSITFKNIYAMLYSLITMIILLFYFGINEAIFIPFVSAFYFMPFVYPLITTNIFICSILLAKTGYNEYSLLALMIASIAFEIIKILVTNENLSDKVVRDHIYTKVVDNVSSEILGFASFLDRFMIAFQTPKEYNERLSEGIKYIVQENCINCPKKKECFSTYKANIYTYFKNLLVQNPTLSSDHKEFFRYCHLTSNIEATSRTLCARFDYNLPNTSNIGLLSQINSVANAMRKYMIDLISKTEIDYDLFIILKKRLINYGYEVVDFQVIKTFQEDYLINIGIKKEKFDNLEGILKLIGDSILPTKVSIILDRYQGDICYFNIVPQVRLEIVYGQGSLSNVGETISGDNVLIKDLTTGKFISAISDGMGKGYSAFCESNLTLNLVNDITKSNIETSTALEILNSFYVVQEYLERYATLDLIEINKYSKIAKFFKMGASTSYIVKVDGTIEKITNQSLPFGIDETVENLEYQLDDNDLIIMSSDGVFENVNDESLLDRLIVNIKEQSPQKIVYELLNYMLNNKIKTNDDMTLVVMKVRYV